MTASTAKTIRMEFTYTKEACKGYNDVACYKLVITPTGEFKTLFPDFGAIDISSLAAMPVEHGLSLVAYQYKVAALHAGLPAGRKLAPKARFTGPNNTPQLITPATFTPH